jgi:hypothetical protein
MLMVAAGSTTPAPPARSAGGHRRSPARYACCVWCSRRREGPIGPKRRCAWAAVARRPSACSLTVSRRAHIGRTYLNWGERLPRFGNETKLPRGDRGIRPRRDAELGERCFDMVLDRARGEKEPRGERLVAVAGGQQAHDVDLARGQPGRVRAGRSARFARDAAGAKRAQAVSGLIRGGRAPNCATAVTAARSAPSASLSARARDASYGMSTRAPPTLALSAPSHRRSARQRVWHSPRWSPGQPGSRCHPLTPLPSCLRRH